MRGGGSLGVCVDFRSLCDSAGDTEGLKSILPETLLSRIKCSKKPALGALAGRDSVAALIKAYEGGLFDLAVPVVVRTCTEYGSPDFISKNVDAVRKKLGDVLTEPVILQDCEFWTALNGRFITELSKRFGFYSPCPGCHLYLYAVRIPLALALKADVIVSGERESHGSTEKINQFSFALDCYENLCSDWGVKLVLPLRHISDEREVDEIIGDKNFSKKNQFSCVFSSNYRNPVGGVMVDEKSVEKYYVEFGLPETKKILATLLEKPHADAVSIVKESFK